MKGLLELVPQLSGIAALLGVVLTAAYFRSENRKRNAEAREREANAEKSGHEGTKLDAEAGKFTAEGQVSIGGLSLQLSESAVTRMKAAEAKADEANAKADAADARADVAESGARDARRRLDAIESQFRELNHRIASCPVTVPPGCPLQAPTIDPPKPPGSGRTQWRGRDDLGTD